MVYALIFAGGVGSRMGLEMPKQFIRVRNKPILVHTLSVFNSSRIIDCIVVVVLSDYIDEVRKYISEYNLSKIIKVIPGGDTAMESQFKGLDFIEKQSTCKDDVVFIHDGVRPFIDEKLLNKCLETTIHKGNAITVSPATETISILGVNHQVKKILPRQKCMIARAPQVFYLNDIYNAHIDVGAKRNNYVDSASLMMDKRTKLNTVVGPSENIKITTQYDLMLCEMWMDKYGKN